MPSDSDDDADTATLMTRVLDEAWKEAGVAEPIGTAVARGPAGLFMALQVMAAIRDGERDPRRLKLVALSAFEQVKQDEVSSDD